MTPCRGSKAALWRMPSSGPSLGSTGARSRATPNCWTRIGREASADPLENLVAAKAVPARDVLRAELSILSVLAELCRRESVSVLQLAA
jgi:hypothetical protein